MSEAHTLATQVAKNASGAVAPPSRRQKALDHFRSLLRALPNTDPAAITEIEYAAVDYANAAAVDAIDLYTALIRNRRK